jgi:hypothetical protein
MLLMAPHAPEDQMEMQRMTQESVGFAGDSDEQSAQANDAIQAVADVLASCTRVRVELRSDPLEKVRWPVCFWPGLPDSAPNGADGPGVHDDSTNAGSHRHPRPLRNGGCVAPLAEMVRAGALTATLGSAETPGEVRLHLHIPTRQHRPFGTETIEVVDLVISFEV